MDILFNAKTNYWIALNALPNGTKACTTIPPCQKQSRITSNPWTRIERFEGDVLPRTMLLSGQKKEKGPTKYRS